MRILAIRGENLASLGQPFTLDFEAEPLAGTGLFAITGETGSGKSTILDALCLALYGRYPRFAEQQADSSPDPGGKMRILDGSTILRRGAGRGYAEADFMGQDGQRYRARWEARRSHNKAHGAVQDAKRSLYSIHPESLVTVATTKTEVQDAVHTKTGLTFEQFCRTVLLVQGEFDSFLLAPERERGDLLEKITGTEIYGRISRCVREGTKALEAEVVELERQLTTMGVLPQSEREALDAELTALRAELAAKLAEADGLQQRLGRVDALSAARERLADAKRALQTAQGEQADAGPLRKQVAELASVERLRAQWLLIAETKFALPGAMRGHSSAQAAFEKASAEATRAAEELRYSQARSDETEQVFKEFGPLWNEAAQLDAKIVGAREELGSATENAQQTKLAAENLALELAVLQQESKQLAGELTEAEKELAARAHQGALADRLEELEELLSRHKAALVDAGTAERNATKARKKADELNATLARLRKESASDTSMLERQTAEASALREELTAFNQPALEQGADLQDALGQKLSNALRAAAQYAADVDKLKETTTALSHANSAAANAAARRVDATAQANECQERLLELSPLAELAEASLDQRTVALRSQMVAGAACPVCGSEEHPYVAPGMEDALTALAGELRERRDLLSAQLAALYEQTRSAAIEVAASDAEATLTGRQKSEVDEEMTRLEGAYSEDLVGLRELTQQLALPKPPEFLMADSEERLKALDRACRDLRDLSKVRLQQVRSLRYRLDATDLERHRTQQRLTKGQEHIRSGEEVAGMAAVAAQHAKGESDRLRQKVDHMEEQLTPLLVLAGIALERLRRDSATVVQQLRGAANAVISARRRQAELSKRAHELAPALESNSGLNREALRQYAESVSSEANRRQTLDALQKSRLPLLGGERTDDHRTRINDIRIKAHERRSAAYVGDSDAKQKQTSAGAAANQALERLEAAQTDLEGAVTTYEAGCVTMGFTREQANALLDQPTTIAAMLRLRLEKLDRAVQSTQVTLNARQEDVDTLAAEIPTPADRDALAAELCALREVEAALNQTLGQRTGVLNRDTLLRQNAAALELDVQAKQERLTTWQEVDSAIGSPSGDRFRLFAQSLTLEQLILLANEHLDSFSKRYHLARTPAADLALHVIDRDMGEEERPTRSLSGGERFLVSLSLALALSSLEGRDFLVDTLFIDEGFGSLDAETLDIATTALESLHSRGRKVGVITHVAGMIENIPVQVKVEKLGGGSSVVRLTDLPIYS